jgi:hypothetical protein
MPIICDRLIRYWDCKGKALKSIKKERYNTYSLQLFLIWKKIAFWTNQCGVSVQKKNISICILWINPYL